jgi:hypothetical protein
MAEAATRGDVSKEKQAVMNDNKEAFDLWWEWAEKPLDSPLTIDAAIHDAVMALPPDERRDRAKVNEAVAEAERANADSSDDAVYDNPHYVQCRWCGKWINGSDPARLAEHRGPLPHPIMPGTEWIDDDD